MKTYSIKETRRIINIVGTNVAAKGVWFPEYVKSRKCRFAADEIREWIVDQIGDRDSRMSSQ